MREHWPETSPRYENIGSRARNRGRSNSHEKAVDKEAKKEAKQAREDYCEMLFYGLDVFAEEIMETIGDAEPLLEFL